MHSVYCEGPPREIGHTIGKSFRAEILRTLEGHVGLNTRFMPYSRTPAGRARYQHLVALHRSRFPDFISELEGMAEGAAVPFEKLFVINLRGEYQRLPPMAMRAVVRPAAWSRRILPPSVTTRTDSRCIAIRPTWCGHGRRINRFSWLSAIPGSCPETPSDSMTRAFVFPPTTFSRAVRGTEWGGTSSRALFWRAGRCRRQSRRCIPPDRAYGFNYTIGSLRERRIVNVEVAPDDFAVSDIRGPYFHANHYVELGNIDQEIAESSRKRYERGTRCIREDRVKGREDILNVLRDVEGRLPILRDGSPPDPFVTLVTALFDLEGRKLTIYGGSTKGADARLKPLVELSLDFSTESKS